MAGFDSRRPPTEEVMDKHPLDEVFPDGPLTDPAQREVPVTRTQAEVYKTWEEAQLKAEAVFKAEIAELKAVVLAQNAKVDCYREQNNGMLYCCDELEKKLAILTAENADLRKILHPK